MKVFLSWSGKRSKETAGLLNDWLGQVIQAVEPWISTDIEKGSRWSPEISAELEKSRVGIICLTRENLDENWILFEAGALSNTKDAYVCTFVLDLKPTDVEQPLGQFQHTSFEKDDIRKLLHTINGVVKKEGERALTEKQLNNIFERFWAELETGLKKIVDQGPETQKPTRSQEEMLQEMLELLRAMERRQQQEQERIPTPYTLGMFIPSTGELFGEKIDRNALVYHLTRPSGEEKKEDKKIDWRVASKSMQRGEQKKKKEKKGRT